MHILRIEHPVRGFDSWKVAFEKGPIGREQSGVRHHRIFQPTEEPNYVMLDLEFESEAEAFLYALRREVWSSREASPALAGSPQTRIVEVMESRAY